MLRDVVAMLLRADARYDARLRCHTIFQRVGVSTPIRATRVCRVA